MEHYENIIHRTFDDSYVITKNGMPYHVCSNVEEFEEEWKAVNAYAKAHPECVTEEQPYVPPVPTFKEAKAAKLSEINKAADKIMAALIGENYAASLIDMTLPSKIKDLYETKWMSKADVFADPTLILVYLGN